MHVRAVLSLTSGAPRARAPTAGAAALRARFWHGAVAPAVSSSARSAMAPAPASSHRPLSTAPISDRALKRSSRWNRSRSSSGSSGPSWRSAALALVGAGAGAASLAAAKGTSPADEKAAARAAQFERNAAATHTELFDELASVSKDGVPYMTFNDFLRSRLFRQSSYDGSMRNTEKLKVETMLGDADGLISFAEYMFLSIVLAVPEEHISVAFLMVDKNQNGELDPDELEVAIRLLADREKSAVAAVSKDVSAAPGTDRFLGERLHKHLFGGKSSLTFHKFRSFIHALKEDMVRMEFNHYTLDTDRMTFRQFGQFLIAHVDPAKLPKFEERIEKLRDVAGVGFSFDEFRDLNTVLCDNADTLEDAVDLMDMTGIGCTESDFRRAAQVAAGVELSKRMVSILFQVFDRSETGALDKRELFTAVHARSDDQIGKPRSKLGLMGRFRECMRED